MIFRTGKWIGMFSNAESFDEFSETALTKFEFQANASMDLFTGTMVEESGEGQSAKEISVVGNIVGDHIEFTKVYVENNHCVYYQGDWDEELGGFKGFWEFDHFDFGENSMAVQRKRGIWAMSLVEEQA